MQAESSVEEFKRRQILKYRLMQVGSEGQSNWWRFCMVNLLKYIGSLTQFLCSTKIQGSHDMVHMDHKMQQILLLLVRTRKSMVMVLVLPTLMLAECHEVLASLSNIFESAKFPSHIPASFEIVAISVSPYQIRSSGEHDSVSSKVSVSDPSVGIKEHVRERDQIPSHEQSDQLDQLDQNKLL